MAHEIGGLLMAGIIAVALISALSPKAQTNAILNTSFAGYNGILAAIAKPVA